MGMTAPEDEESEFDGPSKSQRKRDADALQALGVALLDLPLADFEALPLPEKLRDALELLRRITSRGAQVRQQQYIGKLMRKIDIDPISAAIDKQRLAQNNQSRDFHRLEAWRDRLLTEGEPALAALLSTHPHADANRIRRLLNDAARERAAAKTPAASRELFRYLREITAASAG
jgi:ribosome-associated protein